MVDKEDKRIDVDIDDETYAYFEAISQQSGVDIEDLIIYILEDKKRRGEKILRHLGYSGEFPWNISHN